MPDPVPFTERELLAARLSIAIHRASLVQECAPARGGDRVCQQDGG